MPLIDGIVDNVVAHRF